ncbi:MAG: Ig-like domain-containing protein [Candidatus Colwellbacteria bacterium]|nr:Ig-like domain-containing protein [Candidatus Colwellbacteria bacterium]
MRFTKDILILVGVVVGMVTLTASASARYVPGGETTTYTYYSATSTAAPDSTSATTTTPTTTTSTPEPTPESTTATQPSAIIDNLAGQLNALLEQLIALLTVQIQDLQQQLVVKLGQQPTVTTPTPAATATTTAETAVTSAVAANKPPRVNITFPYGGLELSASASTDVTASAVDDDGTISKVEFFDGATLIGTHAGSIGPWSVRWNNISAGEHILTAKATDNGGTTSTSGPVTTTSAPVTLTVQALGTGIAGFQDIPPVITIATTITGTALTATATVTTYAGSITNVVWSRAASTTSDGAYVTDATSPYNGAATLAVGVHTISAIATNSQGTTARTASTTVTTN